MDFFYDQENLYRTTHGYKADFDIDKTENHNHTMKKAGSFQGEPIFKNISTISTGEDFILKIRDYNNNALHYEFKITGNPKTDSSEVWMSIAIAKKSDEK